MKEATAVRGLHTTAREKPLRQQRPRTAISKQINIKTQKELLKLSNNKTHKQSN